MRTVVGHIAVDAGMCMVGDPCYTIDGELGKLDWAEFLKLYIPFEDKDGKPNMHWAIPFPAHQPAGKMPDKVHRAVIVTTGYGDGLYPVVANINKDGRITSVTIKFS